MTSGAVVRRGGSADVEPAVAVWRAANGARRGGGSSPPEHAARVRRHAENPDAFLFVADAKGGVPGGASGEASDEASDAIVGMAVGMQGLAQDGAGPPVAGLCHVGAVFVSPERWGEGIGGRLVDAVLAEARSRGYDRAQLWTHADNARAQKLYENRGFRRTGREKTEDFGETIVHYERGL